jgi:hypothetical protein
MSLEAKASITYNPDAKKELVIRAPTLFIEEEIQSGSPKIDLPDIIDKLLNRVSEKVQRDFNRPVEVNLSSYTVSMVIGVHPINNRTLDEFHKEPVEQEG